MMIVSLSACNLWVPYYYHHHLHYHLVVVPDPTTVPPDTTTTLPPETATTVAAVVSPVKAQLIALTNEYRASMSVGPLTANAALMTAATRQTLDMATNLFVGHVGTDGSTMAQRVADAGYTGTYFGENAAAGQLDAASVLAAWVASPHHQANLVDPNFDQIGVDSEIGSDGRIYWTMDLGSSHY